MSVQPDKTATWDAYCLIKTGAVEQYAGAYPEWWDRIIDAACAPVVKQRDELLAEVERLCKNDAANTWVLDHQIDRAEKAESLARELLAALKHRRDDHISIQMLDDEFDLIRRATEQLGETTHE